MHTPPVTSWELVLPENDNFNLRERSVDGRASNWDEVVTRYPYRKVWMDNLLFGFIWFAFIWLCPDLTWSKDPEGS